jgi:hypothetical protein
MDIKPIVFAVPNAPARTASKPSLIPWIAVAIMALALAFALFRSPQSDGPGPGPTPVVDSAAVEAAEKASRFYAKQLSIGIAKLADDVDSKRITNAEQLQSNAQSLLGDMRKTSFADVDKMDNEKARGDYVGRERQVSDYLRSKALGHWKASE